MLTRSTRMLCFWWTTVKLAGKEWQTYSGLRKPFPTVVIKKFLFHQAQLFAFIDNSPELHKPTVWAIPFRVVYNTATCKIFVRYVVY